MSTIKVLTLTGPSCSGKTTLEKILKTKGFQAVVSTTTRAPRAGETHGESYYFVTDRRFEQMQKKGEFVEVVEFNGKQYGVTAAEIERITASGAPVCIVCEPKGQLQISAYADRNKWKMLSAFVDAPVDLIMNRYLSRFSEDLLEAIAEGRETQPVVERYSQRMGMICNTEIGWRKEASWYDLVIDQFGPENQDEVVNLIVSRMEAL